MLRFRAAIGLLALVLCFPGGKARAAASGWASEAHGAARLISAVEATGSGTRLDAGVQLRLTPGWHTYWRSPGDAGVAPAIDWQGSENVAAAEIAWPAPERLPPAAGLETVGYEDGIVLPVWVTLAHPGAPVRLHAEIDYASCKDICIPYHASLNLFLPAGLAQPGPEAALIATARARVPGPPSAKGLTLSRAVVAPGPEGAILGLRIESSGASLREPDVFVENAANGSPARPEIAFSPSGREATIRAPIRHAAASALAGTELRVTVVDGSRSAEAIVTPELGSLSPAAPAQRLRLAMAGLALLGGLVLNLMPCVLPVLSLKLLALAGYAGAERRDARLGLLATAAGVLASFAVLAGAAIALKAAGAAVGWGIQFQQPWFLAGMALLTTLFAASLWDWLPIALPGAVAATAGSMRGGGRFAGAFLLGVFATLLAASCSAPFVGTALGFALARGPLDIALVFAGLGLGMAVPFLTAAAAPRLVDWLPRPGRWMGWLRHALGLALLATAAWLLSVLATEISPRVALFSAVLLAALLALLAWRQRQIAGKPMRSVTSAIAAVLAAVAVALPALHGEAPNAAPEPATGLWRPFDAVGLRRQLADGKLVFVDVSAAWCLTCKANELTVLDRSPVADYLRDAGVVAMRADWTRPDPAVTAYLQSFGRYGVPLDVVYGPGAPDGIALPELLTLGAVIDAMGRARAAREAAR